jgi:hypothetical protein
MIRTSAYSNTSDGTPAWTQAATAGGTAWTPTANWDRFGGAAAIT